MTRTKKLKGRGIHDSLHSYLNRLIHYAISFQACREADRRCSRGGLGCRTQGDHQEEDPCRVQDADDDEDAQVTPANFYYRDDDGYACLLEASLHHHVERMTGRSRRRSCSSRPSPLASRSREVFSPKAPRPSGKVTIQLLVLVFFSASSSADHDLFHSFFLFIVIVAAIGNFDQAKTLDKFNESWPKPEPSPQ